MQAAEPLQPSQQRSQKKTHHLPSKPLQKSRVTYSTQQTRTRRLLRLPQTLQRPR